MRQVCTNQVSQNRFLIMEYLDAMLDSGFSLCHGQYPICWRGMSYVFGVSTRLLQSICQTAKARYALQHWLKCTLASAYVSSTNVHAYVFVFNRNTPTAERPSRANISVNGCLFTQVDLAERWLRSFVDNYCDIQPDEGHVHLPFGTRKAVYEMFLR